MRSLEQIVEELIDYLEIPINCGFFTELELDAIQSLYNELSIYYEVNKNDD